MTESTAEDFFGIYPNAVSKEYCERCVARFKMVQDTLGNNWPRGVVTAGQIYNRSQVEAGVSLMDKDSDMYFLGGTAGDDSPNSEADIEVFQRDTPLLREYNDAVWKWYSEYIKKYAILTSMQHHKLSPYIQIKKYTSSQGYHIWHCDNDSLSHSSRLIVVGLYLNDVEEGGETEFLYQRRRIKPEQGTLIMFPAGYTHVHRGNPPLSGDKYFMNSWIELVA